MMRTLKCLAALPLTFGLAWFLYSAGAQPDKELKADDVIETIEVKLDIGAGDDLEEPVALDLGLGFPLWLHPVGRKAEESAPFGAVPQQTTARAKVDAKSSVTFTFAMKAEDGQDALRTTPQLLAGLRVSDIARVGFASQGSNNWILAGYEIKINGKVFAAGKADQEGNAKASQEAARKKVADLALAIAPLETAQSELLDLVKTELATADDRKELKDVAAKLLPLAAAKRRLEGQLDGLYPWFVDKAFRSPWRKQESIQSARVTLITATHSDADTQNCVYLHTGGRKYLLGAPATPLTGVTGPQVFTLDLEAGPLTTADLRGWAVGMLAHPNPLAKAPDRWHPLRVRVEIDGKIAYDSEDNELDRKSLEAIRVIPPVHKDQDGQLVSNTPVSRETFVWQAGRKLGLDVEQGTPLALPDPKDETFPKPETVPQTKDDPKEPATPMDPDQPAPFPGETPADPPVPGGGGDPSSSSGGGGGDSGGGSGGSPDPTTPNDPTKVPTPVGAPFQVHHVRIIGGIWKADQTFKVIWQVTGDETTIDRYVISLQPVQPHLDDPYSAPGIPLVDAPRGSRFATGTLGPLPAGVDPRSLFVRPVVTAIPVDPPADPNSPPTPNAGTGPARAIFPANANIVEQPVLQTPFAWSHQPPPPFGLQLQPISWSGPTPALNKAVWPVNAVVRSDSDVLFDSAWPGRHLGVRLVEGDTVRIEMRIPKAAFAAGKRHFIAHLGFLGEPGASNAAKTQMTFSWRQANDSLLATGTTDVIVPFVDVAAGDTMKLVDQEIDATALPLNADHLRVWIEVTGGPFDLAHPPGLFGVRLVP